LFMKKLDFQFVYHDQLLMKELFSGVEIDRAMTGLLQRIHLSKQLLLPMLSQQTRQPLILYFQNRNKE